jgi:hypothetical protein
MVSKWAMEMRSVTAGRFAGRVVVSGGRDGVCAVTR